MKTQYKNILVPVDGSEQSVNALLEAVMIAKRNGGQLTVLTIKDFKSFYPTTGAATIVMEHTESLISKIKTEVKDIIGNTVHYEFNQFAGNPKKEIVQFAKEQKVDLIVMGATGVGFFERMMLGSTTQYVVNDAPCNVMVVK